ncbi:hypothetical protein FOZ62_009024, partial [Perkinsus olseni]
MLLEYHVLSKLLNEDHAGRRPVDEILEILACVFNSTTTGYSSSTMSHRRRGANHDAWEEVSSSSSDEEEETVVEEKEERLEVPRKAKAEHARATSTAVPATSQKKKTRSEKNRPLEVSSRAPVSAGRERKSS